MTKNFQTYFSGNFKGITIKAAKLFLDFLRVSIARAMPLFLALASVLKPSLPFNLTFIEPDRALCSPHKYVLLTSIVFTSNYLIWVMISVQGYMLTVELLTGTMSVISFQQTAVR